MLCNSGWPLISDPLPYSPECWNYRYLLLDEVCVCIKYMVEIFCLKLNTFKTKSTRVSIVYGEEGGSEVVVFDPEFVFQ